MPKSQTRRKPVVGVMGGSSVGPEVERMANQLGGLIAQRGWVLLNGGRKKGVMAASAKGAKAAGGLVIGILPGATSKGASPDLDVAIITGMGDARDAINVLSSDVVIVCPGALGTIAELALALKAGKRVILLGRPVKPEFERYRRRGQLTQAQTPEEAVNQAAEVMARTHSEDRTVMRKRPAPRAENR